MRKELDFYKGFEGEPELVIFTKDKNDKVLATIRLWVGFFDAIMGSIKPNNHGVWEGVTLHFHEETGWYDESPWRCSNVELFIIQLESIDSGVLKVEENDILDPLIMMLKNSANLKEDVYFEYY